MQLPLPVQLELLETLQALHQQQESLPLHWLPPGPGAFGRHLANLPRLQQLPNPDQAQLLVGHSEQLRLLPMGPQALLCSDPEAIEPARLVQHLLRGYRLQAPRLLTPLLQPLPTEQRLRILVLTNLYPPQELGGYGRSIFDFATNLRLLGHQLQVISTDAPYLGGDCSQDQQVDRRLQLLGSYDGGLQSVSDPSERQRRIDHNRQLLDQHLQQFRPQAALLGNLDMLGPELLQHLVARGVPCWHHHGFSQPAFPPEQLPPAGSGYRPLANSQFTAKALAQFLPAHRPIPVIYPGAQTHLFSDLQPQPLGGPLRIAFAGLLIGAKGAHVLLEALSQLKQAGIPFHAQLAGGQLANDYPDELRAFAHASGIGAQVDFLGKLERHQLRAFLAAHPVFVFPSTWEEPFGISQVEALAAGCLVVSSGTGGAGETVHDDINGRRFRPSDSTHLAAVLTEIWRDPAAHEPLRQRGRKLALSHFDTARESRKLSQLMLDQQRTSSGFSAQQPSGWF
jgi:glycogen(starch) synthase